MAFARPAAFISIGATGLRGPGIRRSPLPYGCLEGTDSVAIARRPLLTAIAAGTLLCALWFVPSANAGDAGAAPGHSAAGPGAGSDVGADTGTGIDTTPYLLGGMAFVGMAAGVVTYSGRRTAPQPAL